MDTLETLHKLANSDIVQAEIPLGLQLGLPWLEKQNGKLCICFMPHKEELDGEKILYYPPQFEIAWVWPFEHLASFRRLTLDRTIDMEKPACSLGVNRLIFTGKYGMDELYGECTKILNLMENNGTVTDAWILSYQKKYKKLTGALGLEAVYG